MTMYRATRVCVAFVACLLPWLIASGQQTKQYSHELNAASITLPPSDPGILAALPCSTCQVLSFSTTNTTVYQIRKDVVTLEEMRRQFVVHPQAHVVVTLADDFKSVRRVLITGGLN
jgi:hypothetical protein